MTRILLLIAGAFYVCVACLGVVVAIKWQITPQPPVVHLYNMIFPDGERLALRGERIESNGLCVSVWLNQRIDTIICRPVIVTEMIEEPQPSGGAQQRGARF